MEIIRLVEATDLPVRATLQQPDVPDLEHIIEVKIE
jgi:hypothetical protein